MFGLLHIKTYHIQALQRLWGGDDRTCGSEAPPAPSKQVHRPTVRGLQESDLLWLRKVMEELTSSREVVFVVPAAWWDLLQRAMSNSDSARIVLGESKR